MELYLILKLVWWVLLGVLFMGLAIMMGMDMGVGALLRFVGKTDTERRVCLNAIGPHWDGNQVWFILGGGAIFAAFPFVYATAFSGMYVVMLLLLWSMIVRPLGFEYRSKLPSQSWRDRWDYTLLISGAVPMIIYGAAMGNLLQGLPFHFDWDMRSYYTGSFLALLNPFAILAGVLSLSMAVFMGGAMLAGRTEDPIAGRARAAASGAAVLSIILFTIGGIWVGRINGFVLVQAADPGVAQNTLHQVVSVQRGAWHANFHAHPLLWIVPGLGYLGMILGRSAIRAGKSTLAWWLGALAWIGVIGTVGVSMFPFLMPSSTDPSQSFTVWNATSSQRTLLWMTGFSAIFVPLILWYTSWCFYVMRGKVSAQTIEQDHHAY
ncbi:cytochrome d ubiquinol oxidase subunit II [Rhodoblastus sp.]|uniref:cytochrome d ubiquinol oxidase subunit II n=1 Tax=Rhodoblastus sp. TaxID=1962975 RepID=UPI003F9A89D4